MLVFVISALVSGVYAAFLIVYRGQPRETIATMKLIFYRLTVLGTQFTKDDLVEQISVERDRRLRLIPFGAMVPLGIIGTAIWLAWLT